MSHRQDRPATRTALKKYKKPRKPPPAQAVRSKSSTFEQRPTINHVQEPVPVDVSNPRVDVSNFKPLIGVYLFSRCDAKDHSIVIINPFTPLYYIRLIESRHLVVAALQRIPTTE